MQVVRMSCAAIARLRNQSSTSTYLETPMPRSVCVCLCYANAVNYIYTTRANNLSGLIIITGNHMKHLSRNPKYGTNTQSDIHTVQDSSMLSFWANNCWPRLPAPTKNLNSLMCMLHKCPELPKEKRICATRTEFLNVTRYSTQSSFLCQDSTFA